MKKGTCVFMAAFFLISLTACSHPLGSSSSNNAIKVESSVSMSSDAGEVNDKSVTVTISKEVSALIKSNIVNHDPSFEFDTVSSGTDGSTVFTMSPDSKKEAVTLLKSDMLDSISALSGKWKYIKQAEIDDSYSLVTLVADSSSFSSSDENSIAASVYSSVLAYRNFSGLDDSEVSGYSFVLYFTVLNSSDYSQTGTFQYPAASTSKTTSEVSGDQKVSGTEYGD
jgi:hypothetical protein